MFIKLKKIAKEEYIMVNPMFIETMEYFVSEFPDKFPNGTQIRTNSGNKFMVEHTPEEIEGMRNELRKTYIY